MFKNSVVTYDGACGDMSSKQFSIAVSTFNKPVTEKLLDAALETLAQQGARAANVQVIWVPGAWELAVAAKRLIADCDAVICLGAVIRGETTHDQHINTMIARTLGQLSVDSGKPIAFGVLTCNTADQAIQRSGGRVGNKGTEATMAAIQMLRVFDQIV